MWYNHKTQYDYAADFMANWRDDLMTRHLCPSCPKEYYQRHDAKHRHCNYQSQSTQWCIFAVYQCPDSLYTETRHNLDGCKDNCINDCILHITFIYYNPNISLTLSRSCSNCAANASGESNFRSSRSRSTKVTCTVCPYRSPLKLRIFTSSV